MNKFFKISKGLNKKKICKISKLKNEPEWMLQFRLKSYETFKKMKMPNFGPDLSKIDFNSYVYFINHGKTNENWNNVPKNIKNDFQKIGIQKAKKKLSGLNTQYDSESIYHNFIEEVKKKGVIFLTSEQALQLYPNLVKKYINTVVPFNDNKFAALNGAVWSGGSFIYVPKGIKLDKPLHSYFMIKNKKFGQFERSLIILEDGADICYIEGCSSPVFLDDSLHIAVVEIIVLKNAKIRYISIQNWSNNIINLVTKRAEVHENGIIEWIDGNIGGSINMKYPACILKGKNAKGVCISIANATKKQFQDVGAKMIHLAPYTKSFVISKSIVSHGGINNYRGNIKITEKALNSFSHVECNTLIFDENSSSNTIPNNEILNNSSCIEHEALVSKVNEEQLFYLISRGLSKKDAIQLIIIGFIEPFSRELPMEYAVEFNRLLKDIKIK